jgi:2-dehydropantoate 2-reductase
MRVIIVGAGCIGTYLGGCLLLGATSQCQVVLVGRARLQSAIGELGLFIADLSGTQHYLAPERVPVCTTLQSALSVGRTDDKDLVIVVSVKSSATDEVAQEICDSLAALDEQQRPERLTVLSMQNGICNGNVLREALAPLQAKHAFNSCSIVEASFGANVVWGAPSKFYLATSNPLIVGVDCHGHLAELVAVLNSTNQMLRATQIGNMRAVLYSKLLVNLNNSINALSGTTLQEQLKHWYAKGHYRLDVENRSTVVVVVGLTDRLID